MKKARKNIIGVITIFIPIFLFIAWILLLLDGWIQGTPMIIASIMVVTIVWFLTIYIWSRITGTDPFGFKARKKRKQRKKSEAEQ